VALDEIVADLENVRGAWRYRVNQADAAQMRMFIHGFWAVYFVRGWLHAGEEVYRQAVEALRDAAADDEEAEVVWAIALARQASFIDRLRLSEQAYDLVKESVDTLERLNQPAELARALDTLRVIAYFQARYDEEEEAGRKIFKIATEIDDKWLLAVSLIQPGMSAFRQQDYGEARRHMEASLEEFEALGDAIYSSFPLLGLGNVSFALGEYTQANEYYLRCLKTAKELGFGWAIVNATRYLGRVALSMGETVEARAYILQSLRLAEEIGYSRYTTYLLYYFARVRVAEDSSERAVELLALVLQQPASRQGRVEGGRIRDSVQDLLATLEAELSPEIYAAAWERGRTLELEEAVAQILRAQA
jgi:tetratricopeptide (TPR) repeat protein